MIPFASFEQWMKSRINQAIEENGTIECPRCAGTKYENCSDCNEPLDRSLNCKKTRCVCEKCGGKGFIAPDPDLINLGCVDSFAMRKEYTRQISKDLQLVAIATGHDPIGYLRQAGLSPRLVSVPPTQDEGLIELRAQGPYGAFFSMTVPRIKA